MFFLWWITASWSCRTFIEQLQIIKNLQVKACWLRSVLKAVGWSTIFHELKSVVKAKIAQIHSQVSEGGITVKLGQESIPELIIWKVNQFFASITCSQYQIAFKWSVNFWLQFLVYDEMENISLDEISIQTFLKLARKLSRQKFHNELACVFTAHYASKNADWNQQQLTDGGVLANRNSANHPYCFLSNQKKV